MRAYYLDALMPSGLLTYSRKVHGICAIRAEISIREALEGIETLMDHNHRREGIYEAEK